MDSKKLRSAQCVIVQTKGSTPRKVGAKMLVFEDGRILGTIGGGAFEKSVINQALQQIHLNEPKLFEHNLLQEHQMCCGGTILVYIEPEKLQHDLIIFGSGHVGAALAKYASQLNFSITLIDDRPECLNNVSAKNLTKLQFDFLDILPKIHFHSNSYIAIMTYDHEIDREILTYCLQQPRAYLGFIGSSRKIAITQKMLLAKQVATQEQLATVDMPMGLDIGAETPEEIAISILAKLIATKNHPKKTKL